MHCAKLAGRCADPPAALPPNLAPVLAPVVGSRPVLPVLASFRWTAVTGSRIAFAKVA